MDQDEKRILYMSIGLGFLLLILLIFALIKASMAITRYSAYKDYMNLHEETSVILKARKDLAEIDKLNEKIKPLMNICLKARTLPIELYDMRVCKDKALEFLGYSEGYQTIKDKANRPLPKEVTNILLEAKK